MKKRILLAAAAIHCVCSKPSEASIGFRLSYEWGPDVGFLFIVPVKFSVEWHADQKHDFYIGIDCSMQPLVWINQIGAYAGLSHYGFLAEEKVNLFYYVTPSGESVKTYSHTPKIGYGRKMLYAKGGPNFITWDNCDKGCTMGDNYLTIAGKRMNLEAGLYFK